MLASDNESAKGCQKTRLDELKALAKSGVFMASAAKTLGISKQRVHQIAKANNLKFTKYGRPHDWQPKPPKSHIIAGDEIDRHFKQTISASAVGTRLAITRQVLGLTQAEMAEMCGHAGRSAWANYETGQRVIPPAPACRLCRAIGVSTDWIYRGRLNDVGRDLAHKIQVKLRKHNGTRFK